MSKKNKEKQNLENEANYLIGCLNAQQLIDKVEEGANFEIGFLEYLGAKDKEMDAYTSITEEKDPLRKEIARVTWKHLRKITIEKLKKYESSRSITKK